MTTCHYAIDNLCQISTKLAGIPVPLAEDACEACQKCEPAMDVNHVTTSKAIYTLRQAARPVPPELYQQVKPSYADGPGTELKKIIAWFWWPAKKCGRCADRVRKMNKWGPKKCRDRRWLIIRWLRQSAEQAGLPFSEILAGAAVDLAIQQAEKKQARQPAIAKPADPKPIKKKYSAVWVYWKGGAVGDELEYSIRSAIANLDDLANVVVCGDHPGAWYDGDFIHSPRFNKQDGIAKFGSGRFSKWIDSAVKLQRIIDSSLVTEVFLWMYDDTFFVKPWSIEKTSILRSGGNLWNVKTIEKPVRKTWREVMRRTAKCLVDRGLPQRNYSTHYPVVYQKALLQRTLQEFDLLNCARLVESIYLNHHFQNPSPAGQVFQYSKKIGPDWSIHQHVSVVNVGGFHERAQEVIKPMFPCHLEIPRREEAG